MPTGRKIASKNSNYEKVTEMDQAILRRQQRAEIKRVIQKKKEDKPSKTLAEEFFEGLDIVQS